MFRLAPNNGGVVVGFRQVNGALFLFAIKRENAHWFLFALQADLLLCAKEKIGGKLFVDTAADQNLAGRGRGHQPRRHIHFIAQRPIMPSAKTTIRACPHDPISNANLERVQKRERASRFL